MSVYEAIAGGWNALASSTGQQRSAWLERQLEPVADTARYYAGPELSRFGAGVGNALAMISPGQDFVDAARASGDLMQSRDPVNALAAGGTMAAALGSVLLPGSVSGANRLADDATDTVVRMLREGRASEVTDDMLAAADPARLFNAYERGDTGADMAMDEASRMARAREMGFDVDTPLYHGSKTDFNAVDPRMSDASGGRGRGFYTTDNPKSASGYADPNADMMRIDTTPGDSPQVYPVVSQGADFGERTVYSKKEINKIQAVGEGLSKDDGRDMRGWTEFPPLRDLFDRSYRAEGSNILQEIPLESFYQNRVLAGAGYGSRSGPAMVGSGVDRVTFKPSNIRSRFARFDPRLKNLSNLSAAVPLAVGAGAASRGMQGDESSGDPELDAALRYIRGGD